MLIKKIVKFFRSKMSVHNNKTFSVNTSETTPKTNNRNDWNSPILKPLPKSLARTFRNENKIRPNPLRICDEDENQEEPDSEEQEDAKFASFASEWAIEDKERNKKLDMLDELEDCMETNMRLSDQIVKMITKLKRDLRSF